MAHSISGADRGLSQRENLTERGPLAHTQKKTCDMLVNPEVDGYTKTLHHRTILRKTQQQQPTENQKNTKTEI